MTDLNTSWNSPRNNCHYWKWATLGVCVVLGKFFFVHLQNQTFIFIYNAEQETDWFLFVHRRCNPEDSNFKWQLQLNWHHPREAVLLKHWTIISLRHLGLATFPVSTTFAFSDKSASGPFAGRSMPRTSETMKSNALKLFVRVFDENKVEIYVHKNLHRWQLSRMLRWQWQDIKSWLNPAYLVPTIYLLRINHEAIGLFMKIQLMQFDPFQNSTR